MKLEIVEKSPSSTLIVDGQVWKKVRTVYYKKYFSEMLSLPSLEQLTHFVKKRDAKIGWQLVYRWLALRGFLSSELKKKLLSYHIEADVIALIIAKCIARGYLDDQREGKLFVKREIKKGVGPHIIAAKLMQRAPELKEMVAQEVSDEVQEREIKRWIEKKTCSSSLAELKTKKRLYHFLRGKGFDDHLIRLHLFID